jgi:orotidine-5'-phosphate decarboxylase
LNFTARLLQSQKKSNSLLCIGLDTDATKIPEFLKSHKNPQYEFNRRIIEATSDIVCAYKINSAFYEAEAERGWRAMRESRLSIPPHVISIADAKRGDIGNSSERYAHIFLNELEFDAVTVNAYMGKDSIAPFIQSAEQCAFILAVTSNPGAKDFQYLKVGKKLLYEKVIEKTLQWSAKKNIGFVAGATKPNELRSIRKMAPTAPLLIPGVGAQGGSIESAVRYGSDKNGYLAIINASRSVIYASSGENFAEAARGEAIKIREEINNWREKFFKH